VACGLRSHDPNAGRETLGAFWAQVRSSAERTGGLSERTLIAYDEVWRLYLSPLGEHPLNAITPADVGDRPGDDSFPRS
jgi:hypothetical protein